MTDVAASEFRHPRRYVRLDTILRLRWLAVLGQLAAIFIVAQGLEFDVPIVPCITIVSLSALLNLALQIAFNTMRRLEPAYSATLLALNIVELAGLLYFTGGLENPFSFLFLVPVLISATVLPVRLTMALGMLAVACASILVFFHLPLPWDTDEPLVLPPIYLLGVWLSIVLAIGVTSLYAFQVTEEARKLSDALAGTAEPVGSRNPAILYGVGNILENAVDFARTTVEVNAWWNNDTVEIVISDDGPGIPPDLIKRIGEPYLSRRRNVADTQSEHQGLGLGVFIARTLLERTGAKVSFSNRVFADHGAVVQIAWPRQRFETRETAEQPAS